MAPISTVDIDSPIRDKKSVGNGSIIELPLLSNGSLNDYEQLDLTPVIGTEFPTANLAEMLNAPNADELITELALTISQRGVVFFRKQNNLTNDLQKKLVLRLGELSGKPASSGLHIHPVLGADNHAQNKADKNEADKEISTISSKVYAKYNRFADADGVCSKKQSSDEWHTDLSFEPVPASYTSLRLTELPPTGGDTLWASGYEMYDRLSPSMQQYLEGHSCVCAAPAYIQRAADSGSVSIYADTRGSPENSGSDLKAVHPVIRTNPVTGWKSIYGFDFTHINGLTKTESNMFNKWFHELLVGNHDLQCRFKWKAANDVAIWDNRSVFHNATYDFAGLGDRFGNRAVCLAERPFFDKESKSRSQDLEERGAKFGRYF